MFAQMTQFGIVAFWGVAMIVFLIVEAATAGLTSIWFAAGALTALICTLLKGPIWLQVVLFLVVSGLTLWLTRPLIKRYINAKVQATNADRIIGMTGVVTENIDIVAGTGAVKLDGKMWTARSDSEERIPEGTLVTALRIEGVRLIVVPKEDGK